MYKLLSLALLFGGLTSIQINAEVVINKGIYGDDNRRLVSELDPITESNEINQAKAVLAQIPKWRVTTEDKQSLSIQTKNLVSGLSFCPDEKFTDLPLVSSCSAFLVGPDLMLTAGHCLKDKYECQKNYWVLDYNDDSGFEGLNGTAILKKENIYSCSQVVSMSEGENLDYALIRLDRKITDRKFLKIRREGKLDAGDSLIVIGHPMGLPKIVADQVNVRKNSQNSLFLTNADTFQGNSGSPVINTKTHLVEGILIRGEEDFKMDIDAGCNRTVHCLSNECKGETVLRTTVLPLKLIPKFKQL